jgi:fructose-bisphosphate aldolase class II
MMAEGRRMLCTIPGVREVFSGETIKEGTRYHYCWRIRFAHPNVIDSYRDHPAHVEFANTLFRPMASDRITIDYRTVSDQSPATAHNHSDPFKNGYPHTTPMSAKKTVQL